MERGRVRRGRPLPFQIIPAILFFMKRLVPVLIVFGVFLWGAGTDHSFAYERVSAKYFDPEVILNKVARDLGVKVIDARAAKSPIYISTNGQKK